MTRTSSTKVVSLSNTTSQIFKSELPKINEKEIKTMIEQTTQYQDSLTTKQQNKTNFEQSSDIIELKLVLQNNSEINIPVSKDGYVNCTKLCQAGNKRIDNWNRLKQSKELIEAYSKLPHFRGCLILRSIEGKNGGTYYPIDIAIQIAQWLSPSFALQVSRWTRELLLFGSVTLGQEKSNKELEEKFQQKIQSLQQTIETVVNENLKIKSTYSHLAELHDQIRMKRNYHKFKKGNCLYIITDGEKEYQRLLKDFYLQCKIETKMTTAGVKNDQLPNKRLTVFKPENSKSTQLSNNIIQVFKFDTDKSLELQGINIIYRKEDGYINLSQLCKAGGKEFSEWKRSKKSKEFLVQLEKTLNEGENVKKKVSLEISRDTLIKYNAGSNTERANWGHPQVAINVAQWISPEFDVKVSKWIFELMLTGSVTLGQEKSSKELEEKFQQKIQSLQQTIENVVNENLKIKSTYSHLAELNDKLRMKRNYHKFKKGNCLYIITDRWREKDYLKIGYTDNINTRLQTYRTSMPDVKIEFLVYLTENKVLEKCLKLRYATKLIEKNHEYVIDATLEQLVKSINSLTRYLNIEATEETKLSLYNEPYKIYNLVFLDQNGNVEDNTDPIVLASPAKPMGLELDSSDDEKDNEPESNTETKNDPESEHDSESEPDFDSDSEVYKCDICGTEYKTKSRFLNHMINVHNIQKDVKDDGKTCPICKKVFRDRGKRNRHVRGVHEKSSQVKCTKCDILYSSNDALMNHIRLVHQKSEQSECAQCGKVCSNAGNLRKHIASVHNKTTSVSCHICHNIFTTQCNLTQHMLNS